MEPQECFPQGAAFWGSICVSLISWVCMCLNTAKGGFDCHLPPTHAPQAPPTIPHLPSSPQQTFRDP